MKKIDEYGITLIALVVTIIILLILAGVTVGMATSGTGLFDKAKEATEKYNNAVNNEFFALAEAENEINKSFRSGSGTNSLIDPTPLTNTNGLSYDLKAGADIRDYNFLLVEFVATTGTQVDIGKQSILIKSEVLDLVNRNIVCNDPGYVILFSFPTYNKIRIDGIGYPDGTWNSAKLLGIYGIN